MSAIKIRVDPIIDRHSEKQNAVSLTINKPTALVAGMASSIMVKTRNPDYADRGKDNEPHAHDHHESD